MELLRILQRGNIDLDDIEIEESESIANGGAALSAYAKMQFTDGEVLKALEQALLTYCELDTLAMVFIWEYFNMAIVRSQAAKD